ncbi:EAL domain-containing protein [Polymorphum gilvum]|uniref:Cyclic diguanylate phosphodiesterase domain protein n=1 Tax=Polymorphum gilvum (strain LMG 25793 / CGMCC 1.9160 / SL003B-26A1) TaxID=991905 RepID=F2J1J5_POLGS|nr:EAL domain-containing protein [Polymorphum gilvum]ADZ70796.1 Cyclic diguanylate phosphodiesterase domain protein [Polymorphum gilvum SL003B-26A1]
MVAKAFLYSGRAVSRRYMIFIRAVCVAIVLAVAPLIAANFILDNYALTHAQTEMRAMAERYIVRGENAISGAVAVLQRLHRDQVMTCAREDRLAFQAAITDLGFVERIGLVDRNGVRMCIVPDGEMSGEAILPALKPDAPLVGIGMLDKQFMGANVAVVSWHLGNSSRLFAEISPLAIAVDPGPDYLRAFRRAELRLGNDVAWMTAGGFGSEGGPADQMLTVDVPSARYPLKAHVTAPRSAAIHLVHDLKMIVAIACAGFAILFVAIGVWFSWRPDSEADDEFVAAIRRKEFIPYYQPVMDIETGRLRGCEVLMRWRRADGTMVSPGQFMPYAESTGHIFEMTRQLMRQTATEVGALYRDHPDLKLSVNLFAGHFNDRQIVEDIKEIYGSSDIAFQQIVVEVTERHPLQDMDLARKIIAELQALGVRVALDDVGTGHGGMAYLQKLGIDIIKIDKMFVDALGTDDSSTTIVDSMVELADNLGMGIIAEGVERMEQIERLRELGVTAAQGYIFAPPLPGKLYIELAEALANGPAPDLDLDEDEEAVA